MEQAEACIDKQDHANMAQTFANESMTALESCENTVTVDWQGSQQYLLLGLPLFFFLVLSFP